MQAVNVNYYSHQPSFGAKIPKTVKTAVKQEGFNLLITAPSLAICGPKSYLIYKPLMDLGKIIGYKIGIKQNKSEAAQNIKQAVLEGIKPDEVDTFYNGNDSFKLLRNRLKESDPVNTFRPAVVLVDTIGDVIKSINKSKKGQK